MNDKKKVMENSFLYIMSSLLVKAIGFLLLPIYTFYLTPEHYGIIELVNSFIGVATFIVSFSLYSSAIRYYTDYKGDNHKIKRFYGTLVTFNFLSGLLFTLFGLVFKEILIKFFFEGISFYPIIFIAIITLIFDSLHTMHQSILQGIQSGKKLTIINIIFFFISIVLKLIFIAWFKLGAVGFLYAQLIVYALYSFFIIIDLKKNNMFEFTIDFIILKEALSYSIPIMPHNLSSSIATFMSRIFLNINSTLATVGVYSVASQFGMLIDTIQASVNKAFLPWFYENMNIGDENSKKEVVNLSYLLMKFYSIVYMTIGMFSQEIILFMTNKKYIMAWTTIPLLVMGYSIKSMYYFYVDILFFYKQASKKIFIATLSGSISDVIIAYILIPKLGMYGAAIAFVIARIITVIIVKLFSKKYDIGYSILKMIRIIVPSLVLMMLGLYFSYTRFLTNLSWYNLIYKMLILFSYLLYLYYSNKNMINRFLERVKIKK